MSNLRKAAEQALEFLTAIDQDDNDRDFLQAYQCYDIDRAMESLRAALADPESKEQSSERYEQSQPVGEVIEEYGFTQAVVAFYPVNGEAQQMKVGEKVYATPPRREPLSYVQIKAIAGKCDEGQEFVEYVVAFTRSIEAAHRITGGT